MAEYIGNNKTSDQCNTLHDGMKKKHKSYQKIIDTLPNVLSVNS